MESTGHSHHRVAAGLGAVLLALPLAGAMAGTAWATDATASDHGKALAKGHVADAAEPVVGPVAPSTTAVTPSTTTTTATTTTTTSQIVGPVAPATTTTATTSGLSDHSTGTAATVGSVTSPQPASNADSNNTGANDTSATNQYTSTRSGLPSLNGNGSSTTTGKPCAGCVGKADNKNPPGQYPNGTDANAGYECDRNNGIGKTNPAHTGCPPLKPPTPPTPPCVPVGPVVPGTCTPLPPTPPLGGGSTGGAQIPPLTGQTTNQPAQIVTPSVVSGNTPAPAQALPFTGAPVGLLAQAALLLVSVGLGLVVAARTRRV